MRRTSLAILTLIAILITACFPAFPLAEGQPEKPDLAAAAYAAGFALDISGWKELTSPISLTLLYVKETTSAPQADLSLAPGAQKISIPLPLSLQGAVVVKGLSLENGASYLTQLQAIAEDGQTTILSQTATAKAAPESLPTVPTKIAFANKSEDVFEGGTFDLPMVIAPLGVTKAALGYTSGNENVATVDAAGVVTGVKKGKATISASFVGADGKKLSAKVTVQVLRPVAQVELNWTEHVLAVGKKVSVRATVSPASANDRSVTYTSSDESIATVDKNGSIKGLKAGTCVITAASTSNPEITAVCQLTVVVPVSKMTLDAGNATIYVGQTLPIAVAYQPQDASLQAAAFKSSALKVATVDEMGVVTGVARGRATITATAKDGSGAKATKTITVLQQPQVVSFKNPPTLLKVGTSQKITAIVSPVNTSDKTLVWSSSDEDIATVKSGTVRPLYPGKVTITATAKDFPDVSVSCEITVVQPATKIALSETKLNVLVKETAQLNYEITPDYTTDKSVVWASSKPQIASVDQNGLVTAHKRGTATITVTCQDGSKKYARATVNVIQPLYGMTLNKDELRVGMGSTTTIKAVLDPPDASNTKIHWSSENPNVARVSGTSTRGSITGISWGDTEITAVADDGDYTDTAIVHVGDYNKAVEIVQLSLIPNAEGSYTPFIQIKNWSNMEMDTIDFSIQGMDINDALLTMGHNHAYVFGQYRTDLAPGAVTSSKGFYYQYAGNFTGIEHVKVAITGYTTTDGVQWHIAIADRDWLDYKTADFLAAHPGE